MLEKPSSTFPSASPRICRGDEEDDAAAGAGFVSVVSSRTRGERDAQARHVHPGGDPTSIVLNRVPSILTTAGTSVAQRAEASR
jgi:hypothetical protein